MRGDRITVEFTKTTRLPRFTMNQGEEWEARACKLTDEGLEIGGGIAPKENYSLVGALQSKAPQPTECIFRNYIAGVKSRI
jgi:hypothetical protein